MKSRVFFRLLPVLLAVLLLALLLFCAGYLRPASTSGDSLSVYFFPIGKADAILLKTPNAAVLIDTGEKQSAATLIDALEQLGVSELDCLILTHFDLDHAGGAAKLLERFPIDRILQSNCPQDNSAYRKYTAALSRLAALTAEVPTEDLSFTLDGMSFTVYAPAASYRSDESNNSSLVVSVRYGSRTLLFTGDAGTERLQELMNKGLGQHDFIKLPHHGAYDSLLPAFLRIVKPTVAVTTCSAEEPVSKKTAALLRELGIESYLTSEGLVCLTCDGTSLSLSYVQ